ncbi:MAG: glycosyltransferase family 39 protein [Candidatus Palauibacterales bacterium]|nr:glycosyltransferase family 39 protein [Candidatus Palauibacterales bacterium]
MTGDSEQRAGEGDAGRIGGLSPAAWAGVAVALHVLLGLLLYDPTLFTGGDNAGYMILGDALRSFRGYLDLHLPETPLHTKYPPGYPAALAVVGLIGGLQAYKLFSLACTAAAVWLIYRTGRRLFSTRASLAAAFLFAVNPVLLEYSHWVLSEAFFGAAVLLSVAAYAGLPAPGSGAAAASGEGSEHTSGPGTLPDRLRVLPPASWAVGLGAALLAFLIRTAGLPLLLAVLAFHALRREWRRLAVSAALVVAVAGGWIAYGQMAGGSEGYLNELLMRNPYDPSAGTVGLAGLVERGAVNLWTYVSAVLPGALTGQRLQGDAGGAVTTLLGLAVTGLALGGWLARGRERVGVAELFTFLYVGLIAVWPDVWTDRRFLLPVLPLLLLYATGAVDRAAGRWELPGRGALALGAAALLALPALHSAGTRAPDRVRCLRAYADGSPCVPAPWASFLDAARWSRDNLPPGATVVNRKPRIFYWISGHRGRVYRFTGEPDLLMQDLRDAGADFVVVDQISGTTARYLVPAVRANQRHFEMLYQEGRPPTYVLRFRPEPPVALRSPAASPGTP